MTTQGDFKLPRVVNQVHAIPRFGHSNNIANLASINRTDQEDYIRGVLAFSAFLIFGFFVWGVAMIFLKVVLPELAGWAAGGKIIDVANMRKQRIPRHTRRARILRNWRLQWTFLLVSIMIPITTLLIMRNGLAALVASLDDIRGIADDVVSKAYIGMSIAESLDTELNNLDVNFTQQDMTISKDCLRIVTNASHVSLAPLATITDYIQVGLTEVETFIKQRVLVREAGLQTVAHIAKRVEDSIEWTHANDWALKFFLMTINVVNGFFLVGVFLSKQDIVSHNYQRFLSNAMIPIWIVLLILNLVLACGFGMALMLNSDFCNEGGNPEDTIKDAILKHGYSRSSLLYTSFLHYAEDCVGENPLGILSSVEPVVQHTKNAVNLLENRFASNMHDGLGGVCTTKDSYLAERLPQLLGILDEIQQKIRAAAELTSCHQVAPIIRRILYGTTCSGAVSGLSWIFGSLVSMTVMGFVMLSTRASLFNAIIRAPRRKRRQERELEFDEYKRYMSTFYEDIEEWEMDMSKKKAIQPSEIPHAETFETEDTSSPRPDFVCENQGIEKGRDSDGASEDDDGESHIAYIQPPHSDTSESSYESDYSSSDSEDDVSLMSNSLFSRFLPSRMRNGHQGSIFESSVDSECQTDLQLSILELQTPRHRRKNSTCTPQYLPGILGSPQEHRSQTFFPEEVRNRASPLSPRRLTPAAPSKPKRLIQRTKGANKND